MKLELDWISGFIDGVSTKQRCFSAKVTKKSAPGTNVYPLQFFFIVSQDQRSTDVLFALKKYFGCGSVKKLKNNVSQFSITNPHHLRDKVIPHFIKYPLQTTKRLEFYTFAQSLHQHLLGVAQHPGDPPSATYCTATYNISAGWWRGIVDAAGCFLVDKKDSSVIPVFRLEMHSHDGRLAGECQRFIRCGTLPKHVNLSANGEQHAFQLIEVTDLREIETLLVPFFQTRGSAVLLRTIRRISFQKWRKIVRYLLEQRYLNAQGAEQIERYVLGLTKHNETLHR